MLYNPQKIPNIWAVHINSETAYNNLKNKTIEELILLVNNSTINVIVNIAKQLIVEKNFNLDNLIFL